MLYYHHPSGREHDPSALGLSILSPSAARRDPNRHGRRRLGRIELREAPAATENELALVHSIEHVNSIRDLSEAGGGRIDDDTFVTEPSYRAALHAAGAAGAMARALVAGEAATGFCATRPAGHHAERDRAMGFCLFNNVVIAAELAIRELGVDRILILDWESITATGPPRRFAAAPTSCSRPSIRLACSPAQAWSAMPDPGKGWATPSTPQSRRAPTRRSGYRYSNT